MSFCDCHDVPEARLANESLIERRYAFTVNRTSVLCYDYDSY